MRSPRRSFAAPFVITLAAIPACTVTPAPAPRNPPPTATVTETPPPTAVVVEEPRPHENPPPPREPPIIHGNPPAPQPEPIAADTGSEERRWTLAMSGGKCTTRAYATCPPHEPGKPMRTCNPPAPQAYECLSGMTDGSEFSIVQQGTRCVVPPPAVHCPPKVMCNPPPPRTVACPK